MNCSAQPEKAASKQKLDKEIDARAHSFTEQRKRPASDKKSCSSFSPSAVEKDYNLDYTS